MNATRRSDAIVAGRLREAAEREPLPGPATGSSAPDLARHLATGATAPTLAHNLASGSAHQDRFTAETAAAVAGTALALDAARTHPGDLWAAAAAAHRDPVTWFEQAVVLGHPTHPLARLRGSLDPDQIRAYAPEHRPRFDLGLHHLPGIETSPQWPLQGRHGPLLPVHPWQAAHLDLDPPQTTLTGAAPLMSLRTVTTGPWHIKCAVDLQLTSAVRHVSPAATHNGPILSRLLAEPARKAGITILPEHAAAATGPAGPRSDLAAIVRPAPHTLGITRAVPLAALAEPCPTSGRPIAAALAGPDLETWWARLAAALTGPPRLLAEAGVALEAHGQNTLVAFDTDARPTGLVYRDLGGVRVPKTGWPVLEGDLQTDDAAERARKLLAALYPTTLTALVDAIAAWTGTDPGRWWKTVADTVRAAVPREVAEAVTDRPWPAKATCAMRLADAPTADVWVTVDNPMARA